jgi:hypothetical protein
MRKELVIASISINDYPCYHNKIEKLVNSIPNSLTFTIEDQAVNLLLAHAKETAITIIEEASSLGNL